MSIVAAMIEPKLGIGREIEIVIEDILGARQLRELHQETIVADIDMQRI